MAPSTKTLCLDNDLVARVASLLDSAGIPNVLWGNYLLRLFGVPTVVQDVSFAIPDESIPEAISILLTRGGLSECGMYETCPTVRDISFRTSPAPSSHVHVDRMTCVCLFKASETLWFLDLSSCPPLGELTAAKDADEEGVETVNREKENAARFPPEVSTVRVPTPTALLEAYVLLMARDRQKVYKHFWSAMLTYMREFVEGKGLIIFGDLRPRCREVYEGMFDDRGGFDIGEILEELGKEGRVGVEGRE